MTSNLPSRIAQLLRVALSAAELAAVEYKTRRLVSDAFSSRSKPYDGTQTTKLDECLDRVVCDRLMRDSETSAILSEESGYLEVCRSARFTYVVDALDGSSNAEMGLPIFALSIGVVSEGKPCAGLLYSYPTSDIWLGATGEGSFRNGEKLKVSENCIPSSCRVALSRPFSPPEVKMYADCMMTARRSRLTGCPSLDVAGVASGMFSAYFDYHVQGGLIYTHDILAAAVILTEAGGCLLSESGSELDLDLNLTAKHNVFAVNNLQTFHNFAQFFNLRIVGGTQ